MKRHVVAKLGVYVCLSYCCRKPLFSVLSPKRFDILIQMHLAYFNMTLHFLIFSL